MRSSNPILRGIAKGGKQQFQGGGHAATVDGYLAPAAQADVMARTERMTIDDVVVRTVALLGLTGLVGAATWTLATTAEQLKLAWMGGMIVGLVLGLVISLARITNPVVISLYAIAEGVFLGAVSRVFNEFYPGIVVEAVLGTFGLFIIMAMLYKSRVIRATPQFTKMVMAALIGVVSLALVNLVLNLFFHFNLGLRSGGPLAIVFSLVCIAVASLTFVLDFAAIEEGVRAGADRKYAWYNAFGLLVGLVWLYLEILRLLSYLRD